MQCFPDPAPPPDWQFQADYRFAAALLAIFRLVQRHRALCAGWPLSEVEAPAGRDAVAAAVEAALAACRPAAHAQQAFVTQIGAAWRSLLAGAREASAEMLFLRHCRLIAHLLGRLAELVAPWAELDRRRDYLFSAYVRQLPELAECLGQLRGLGCGVAAAGTCAPVTRTRLLFLCSSAQALLGVACQRYRGLAPPVEARVARTAADSLVHVLRAEFLRDQVAYPVADFYRLATESIDTVFVWIEAVGAELAVALPKRRQVAR